MRAGKSHNEIIVDLRSVAPGLPHSIEAVFYIADRAQAQGVHQKFMRQFGLSAEEFPLLRLSGDGRTGVGEFSLDG